MRQALGLREGSPHRPVQRREAEHRGRRFVRDGEVPVVVLNGAAREPSADPSAPTNRLATAEATARTERLAREAAERQVAELHALTQHLKTQLAHAELAHRDALDAERQAREAAEAALREAHAVRGTLEAQVAELNAASVQLRARRGLPSEDIAEAVRPRRERRRQEELEQEAEPEPVKWWLPREARG